MSSRHMSEETFFKYLKDRYKGKIHNITVRPSPYFHATVVHVQFHLPADEVDELEAYRRINKVIHVIAEGDRE